MTNDFWSTSQVGVLLLEAAVVARHIKLTVSRGVQDNHLADTLELVQCRLDGTFRLTVRHGADMIERLAELEPCHAICDV